MTIGTGIFLSSLLLSFVLLYIITRDRWKWKKIVLRSVAVVIGLALLIGAGIYAYTWYEDRPKRAESLWDVAIGASQSDVMFAKGEPSEVLGNDDGSKIDPRWVYRSNDVDYTVDFRDDKVTRIMALGNRLNLPSVSGVSTYSSLDQVLNKLGPPSYISRSKDGLKRTYSFSKYNVAFGIAQGEIVVVAVGVTDNRPVRFADEVAP